METILELGQKAKDKITGHEGVLTGRCSYITGCDQYLVTPQSKDGTEYPKSTWIDVHRLEIIGEKTVELDTSVNKGACESAPIK